MISVGLFLPPGFQAMSLVPLTVFEVANMHLGEVAYTVASVSENGGLVASSVGFQTNTHKLSDHIFGTLLLGTTPRVPDLTEELASAVRCVATSARRCGSIGNAAIILAAAGLLAGRRIASSASFQGCLQNVEPTCQVEAGRALVVDGPIWSCGGMATGIDLALALVEDDFGRELARSVSRTMAMRERRDIGQRLPEPRRKVIEKPDRVQRAMSFARDNLRSEITVESMAEAARLSPRQFSRVFRSETGLPPGEVVERLRVEAARLMLTQGKMTTDAIALEAGFGDRSRMERALQRVGAI